MSNTYSKVGFYNQEAANNFYNIYTSNASINDLNKSQIGLPANALIISSPYDKVKNHDKMTPSIAMTDGEGTLLPLTYSCNSSDFIIDESINTMSVNWNKVNTLSSINTMENNIKALQSAIGAMTARFNALLDSKSICKINEEQSIVSYFNKTTYELCLGSYLNQKLTLAEGKTNQINLGTVSYESSASSTNGKAVTFFDDNISRYTTCIAYQIDRGYNTEDIDNNIYTNYISRYSYIIFNRINSSAFAPIISTKSNPNELIISNSNIYNHRGNVIGTYTYFIYPPIESVVEQTNNIKCYIPSVGNYLDSNFTDIKITWRYSADAVNRVSGSTDPGGSIAPEV